MSFFFSFLKFLEMCELNKSELKVTTLLNSRYQALQVEDIFEISSSFEELFKETKIYFHQKFMLFKKFRLLGIFFEKYYLKIKILPL